MYLQRRIIMRKTKLLALPLVIMMTACNKPAPGPKEAELPAGGEEVVYNKDAKGDENKGYQDALEKSVKAAVQTISEKKIEITASVKANAKNVPINADVKSDINAEGNITIALAAPTENTYSYSKIALNNLNLTITNLIPETSEDGKTTYKSLEVKNLKLALYTQVKVDPENGDRTFAYVDLSDSSVETLLSDVLGDMSSVILTMLGNPRKGYADISALVNEQQSSSSDTPEALELSDETSDSEEEEPEETVIPDVLGAALAFVQNIAASVISQIKVDISKVGEEFLKYLPLVKLYKDGEELNRIGLKVNVDLKELVNDATSGSNQPTNALAAEEEPKEEKPTITDGRASAAVIVGKTHGTTELALEEANAVANVSLSNGISADAEGNLNVLYNAQSQFAQLTDSQVAEYQTDYASIIEMIIGLVGGLIGNFGGGMIA